MKILLLIDTLNPGGAETHVLTLAHGLISRGHSVAILSDGGALEPCNPPASLRFFRPRRPLSGAKFALSNLWELIRLQKRESFDVLHAHTRKTAFLLRLFRLFFRPQLPRVSGRAPYRKRSLRRVLHPALIVTCHAKFQPRPRCLSYWGEQTVAVSEDLKEHLGQAFGLSPSQVTVIENGVDLSRFYPTATQKEGQLRLVYASRLDKDCSAAARLLLNRFADWRRRARERGLSLTLTIAGGGECSRDIKQQANRVQKLLGEPCIFPLGAVEQVEQVLAKGDLFIGVSRAAIEAMCCGLGVILAGDEGLGGLLTPGCFDRMARGNFCCRGEDGLSENALDAAFDAWLNMTEEEQGACRCAIGSAARARYDSARMAERTEEVYLDARRRRRPLRALVLGYAGCGNLGDDIILRRLTNRWHQKQAPLDLSQSKGVNLPVRLSLSAGVGSKAAFEGIATIHRRRPTAVLGALIRSDALVLGGGCLLQTVSKHGRRSLLYYLSLLWAARMCGCPYYLVASGLGPLEGRFCRALTAFALKRAIGISVRDERSFRLCLLLGVHPSRLSKDEDPALSLCPPPPQERGEMLAQCLNRPAKEVGRWVCVVPKPMGKDALECLAQALERTCRQEGRYPLLMAFDTNEDVDVCQRLSERIGGGQVIVPTEEREVLSLFSEARCVISGRLHGLILARAAGATGIALDDRGRDRKTVDFASRMGWDILDLSAGDTPPVPPA